MATSGYILDVKPGDAGGKRATLGDQAFVTGVVALWWLGTMGGAILVVLFLGGLLAWGCG